MSPPSSTPPPNPNSNPVTQHRRPLPRRSRDDSRPCSYGGLFRLCHPDRSGPIFLPAPLFGASGRVVEGPGQPTVSYLLFSAPPRCPLRLYDILVFPLLLIRPLFAIRQ